MTEPKKVTFELPDGMTPEDLKKALLNLSQKKDKKALKNTDKIVFSSVVKSESQEIRVYRDVYKDRELLSIREWYIDKDTSQWAPGRGVSFHYEDIETLLEGLTKMKNWCEENPEDN